MSNMFFCKEGTKIIEIFQARSDCTFWYLSQQLDISYEFIKTIEFPVSSGHQSTFIPLNTIKDFIKKLKTPFSCSLFIISGLYHTAQ